MSDTQLPPDPIESPSIWKSRKTRKALGALIQAVVAVAAALLAQKTGAVSEEQATTLIIGLLSFIGSLTGADILATGYEDGQEKKNSPLPPPTPFS